MKFSTINPATGQKILEYEYESLQTAHNKIANSLDAYKRWRCQSVEFRAEMILGFKAALEKNLQSLAEKMTIEMGKPIAEAQAEIKKSIALIEYFAKQGPSFLKNEIINSQATESYITFQPMGPILGIMPWNFPLWQIIRFAIPTLILGNTVLIKHADNTVGSALLIEQIFNESGLNKHVYQNLILNLADTGRVIDDFRVRGVSLTGSVRAGREVASRAGQALKKVVLELGGSDAYIVLEDADIELAASECVKGRFVNAGQSCVSAKRFIVVDEVFEKFQEKVLSKVSVLKTGSPLDENVHVGPLARKDLMDQLATQVKNSVKSGARLLLGGESLNINNGFFYAPTVLTDVKPGVAAFDEELFGPVCVLIRAKNETHALELANQSEFGLGAAIFTTDMTKARRLAEVEVDSGSVFVNEYLKSNPLLPFGGVRNSGVGREMSRYGMLEFANIKTVWIK